MQRRPLGDTGILVPPIGLGTVKLGRTAGLKHPAPFELPTDEAAANLLSAALDLGVDLIDTAPAYGVSEERLGALLAGQRDRWVICTKAGESFDGETSTFDFSAAAITASIERSLQRLRTDHLDVALLHCGGHDVEIIEQSGGVEALERMKEQGKIRAIGASTKTAAGGMLAVNRLDVAMLTRNPRHLDDGPALEHAPATGAGVLIKKALLSGHVAGGGGAPAPSAEVCVRFALEPAGVSAAIVGTTNPEHLAQTVRVAGALETTHG